MPATKKRREPHDVAVEVFRRYGVQLWLGSPEFSAKWLNYYRPLLLLQAVVRPTPFARFLESVGFLPKRYCKIAYFDADEIVLTVYQHYDVLKQAAREISAGMGVEIKVVPAGRPVRSVARAA